MPAFPPSLAPRLAFLTALDVSLAFFLLELAFARAGPASFFVLRIPLAFEALLDLVLLDFASFERLAGSSA